MPRLLIFAACERAIISEGDNMPSLIGLLQTMTINGPEGQKPPAAIPTDWSVFCLWFREPQDEESVSYEQKVTFSGDLAEPTPWDMFTQFDLKKPSHRIIIRFPFFPALPAGIHNLRLLLRKEGEKDWVELASYPMQVSYATHSLAPA
jgi:hypothetical protein